MKTETIIVASIFMALLYCTAARADVTVMRGNGPQFPLQVDAIFFIVKFIANGSADSSVKQLPVSFYAEVRDNIDSSYTYPQALRAGRKELAGCKKGFRYGAQMVFRNKGARVMSLFFSCDDFGAAKCMTSADPYPFVVVFTKGFSRKLHRLASQNR